jgi:hypothetical protein
MLACTSANFRRPESLSLSLLLLLLSLLLLLLLSDSLGLLPRFFPLALLPRFFPPALLPRFFPPALLPRFFPSELLSSDSLELLSRLFFSEPAVPELLARLPRDTSLILVVEQLFTLLSRGTALGLAVEEQLSMLLSRALLAVLAARLLAAPLPRATSGGPISPALLFLAQISVCALETLFSFSLLFTAGMLFAVRSMEDIIESEAAKDMAGELSRRRRPPPPNGSAMARPSAASGSLPAAAGVRTCATFSFFFSAAGGPLGLGVEVVLGPLAAFFVSMMLSSVSPKTSSPKQKSDLIKYKSLPPFTLLITTSGMYSGLSRPTINCAGASG